MSHRVNLRKGETQANGEQQKYDAKLGNDVDVLRLHHRAGGMRPQHDADRQIGKAGRNSKTLEHQHDEYCRPEQQECLYQCLFKHHAGKLLIASITESLSYHCPPGHPVRYLGAVSPRNRKSVTCPAVRRLSSSMKQCPPGRFSVVTCWFSAASRLADSSTKG